MWVMDLWSWTTALSHHQVQESLSVASHFIVETSNKAVDKDDPKVYHKEIYNLRMSHWRTSEFVASLLPASTSVLTSPLITTGEKFCILWESCGWGVREVRSGHWIYEQAGLWQRNSQTLLTHVPGLTLLLGMRNSFNKSTYLTSLLKKNKEVERSHNHLCFLLILENTVFPWIYKHKVMFYWCL